MNREEIYHKLQSSLDTEPISGGKLTGTTDTDYFYFLCPNCEGGGKQVLRILNYGTLPETDFRYKDIEPIAEKAFQFAFELYCPNCGLHTMVKLSNEGLQDGKIRHFPFEDSVE